MSKIPARSEYLIDPNDSRMISNRWWNGLDSAINAAAASSAGANRLTTAFKPATTPMTNNALLAIDPDLQITLAAGTYALEVVLNFAAASGGTQGFKYALNNNASATNIQYTQYVAFVNSAAQAATGMNLMTTAHSFATIATTGLDFIAGRALLTLTNTNLIAVYWCQNTATVATTNLLLGSYITATKL